jgi:hypothetical protein
VKRKQIVRKGQMIRRIANFVLRLKTLRRVNKHGLRWVNTAHGKVRVLEYGFEDTTPQPL